MSNSTSGPDLFNRLADDFAERYRRGERPPLSEYTEKYPELAEQIHELFPALVAIEQFGSGADRATGLTAPRPETAGQIPERLGDYRILREIARGGMGIVYEAVQESLGRHVALKVLPQYRLHDPNQLERFQREARAAAMLHHTNIVPVFGVGEHDGVHHYAMQYIQGQSLDAVLREVKRLRGFKPGDPAPSSVPGDDPALAASVAIELVSGRFAGQSGAPAETVSATALRPSPAGKDSAITPLEAGPGPSSSASAILGQSGSSYYRSVARLGVQVAGALAYAHQHKLLHRDIKPSNLLLDMQGTIWVTDFGLVKAEGSGALTQTGDIVGTLRYVAPERFRGEGDARSDVYALGLTLYEMLTLEPAFTADQRSVLIDKILHEEPRKPRQSDPRIPNDLETIALKAIAKDPSDRYRTASELAEDLRRYLADRPILARRASALEQARRWCRRNPLVAASIATVAAALVAVAVLALLYAGRQRHFAVAQAKANTEINRLNTDLGKERERLTTSLSESNRLLAIRNFERGQAAFEKGEIGPGLLWMVESWRSAVAARDPVWQHAAKANLAAWQPHHARLKAVFSHAGTVQGAAFSPDGKSVLTGGRDHLARLWDAASGKPIGNPIRHDFVVNSVAFSPDGKTLLTGCLTTARLWDAATGQPIGSPFSHSADVQTVAYSPDGRTVITGDDHSKASLWDVATGRLIGQPLVHSSNVTTVAFSPDGKTLVSNCVYEGHGARLWNAATGQPIGEFKAPNTLCVAFSPDSKCVLIGTGWGTVRWWDAATGKLVGEPIQTTHQLPVLSVAVSPDGRTFLTGSSDKTARLFDALTNQPIGRPLAHHASVGAVAFSPDGKTILTASDNTVRLWDADPGQPFGLVFAREGMGQVAAFSRDGKTIFSGDNDGAVARWDAATGLMIGRSAHNQQRVQTLAVSHDGTRFVTSENSIRQWDTVTGKPAGPTLEIGADNAVYSPDDKTIATVGGNRILFWDALTGTQLGQPIWQHSEGTWSGAFSPDGKSFLNGSYQGSAQMWDVVTRTPVGEPFPHRGTVLAAAFSRDGKTLLTGCADGGVRLWDVETRSLRFPPLPQQGGVYAVAFNHDETLVLTGDSGSTARLWDAATGMPLGPPIPHPGQVLAVAFSPDGTCLLTGAYQRGARLFRRVPELPDDLDRVAAWMEVLTGLTLDAEHGTIQPLDHAAWQERRRQLEQRGGPPETAGRPKLDPIPLGADPIARGRVLIERGRWDEAEAAFDEVVRARPNDASSWIDRGGFHIAHGKPERASADFALAMRLEPENLRLRRAQALSLLAQGDEAGLRRACSDLLGRLGGMRGPETANLVAWSCVLRPDSVTDREAPIRLAERAVKDGMRDQRPIFLNTLGAALYRAGRFEESIRRLEESIPERNGNIPPQGWVFLALAHQQLGHRAEALRWLDRVRTYKTNAKLYTFWTELEVRFLRREAEAVVQFDPVFPADPFAR